jgi:hypothetical protein
MASAPPQGQVTIFRDPWGVPHIQARREQDGFYGLGYAVTEDYLEDVLRQFVIGRGEMARYFGPKYLDLAQLYELFRVRHEAEAGYRRLPENLRRNIDSYVEGVQRYISDHPKELPSWASDLTLRPQDLVGFEQFFTLVFPVNTFDGIEDCRRGGAQIPSTSEAYLSLLRMDAPALLKLQNEVQENRDPQPEGATLLRRLREGANIRSAQLGNKDAVYGDLFRIGRGGQTFPIGGCATAFESTLRNFVCPTAEHVAVSGQKNVMLTIFSDPIQSFSWETFGNNWRWNGKSIHYNDQSQLASERRSKPTYFEYSDLMRVNPTKTTLTRDKTGGR